MSKQPSDLPLPEKSKEDLERYKLRAEIEKIRAETRSLRRPTFFNPTTIAALSAAVLGWFTALHQTNKAQENETTADNIFKVVQTLEQKKAPVQASVPVAPILPAATPVPTATGMASAPPQPLVTPSPSAFASPTKTPSKARLYVYFANINQIGRLLGDVYAVFPSAGFDVVEAKRMEEERRPKVTEILYFDDRDESDANRLQGILHSKLDVESSVRRYDPRTEVVPSVRRKRHEFEIWFDRSVRSPAKGLIRLFGG